MDRKIEKKKWTISRIALLAGAIIFVGFVLYLVFLRDKSSKIYVDRNQLTIAEVKADKFQEFIPVDGIVLPKTTIYIDAIMGGNVNEIYVEDGALLRKGDPILRLVNTNLELSYMEQETRIYEAINNLQNTKIGLEQTKFVRQKEIASLNEQLEAVEVSFIRQKALFLDSLISNQDFEDAERAYRYGKKQLQISLELQKLDSISTERRYKQIDQSMDRLYNNLELLKASLDNLTVKAPADGQLSSFSIEVGQTANSGEHLGQIDNPDEYKLRANIDERYISRVSIGQEAEFDFGGKTYLLTIQKIYTDVTAGSFQVDLFFENGYPDHIKRGQTLQLRLKFSSQTDALIVRRGGFFQKTGGNWIYVLDASEEFAVKRPIRINRQNILYYEVLEGLEAGEKVIVSSYDNFGDKDRVVFK
ncbi:MAG TPA: HlyD family efflux transporter periplasmic adaptor subunit [Bacteroidales bacterium]|nr:HlyD family efflux transporter periplasmic adaptor subunit [Bacteroidales bacterium]HPE42686.1 HlyD family efflux transporter periplasmic adaptor subunit [Bacteroidales bacterium]